MNLSFKNPAWGVGITELQNLGAGWQHKWEWESPTPPPSTWRSRVQPHGLPGAAVSWEGLEARPEPLRCRRGGAGGPFPCPGSPNLPTKDSLQFRSSHGPLRQPWPRPAPNPREARSRALPALPITGKPSGQCRSCLPPLPGSRSGPATSDPPREPPQDPAAVLAHGRALSPAGCRAGSSGMPGIASRGSGAA